MNIGISLTGMMAGGTRYIKNINCPSVIISKGNRNTEERKAAEVYGGTEITQDHAKHT